MILWSEDQRAAFHQYLVPEAWRGYFVLENEVSTHVFGRGDGRMTRVRLKTLPMGWVLSVDLIQRAHEILAERGAGMSEESFFKMGHEMPTTKTWHSIYVDNFDMGSILENDQAASAVGLTSDDQLALRAAYMDAGVERDPKKAAEGVRE